MTEDADKYPNAIRPAYPTNNRMFSAAQGLTKREYFAAVAMQGILANPNWIMSEDYAANAALVEADKLLEQLETPKL